MPTVVGVLQVDVTTGQATFTFDEAKKQLDSFGKSAKDSGGQVDKATGGIRNQLGLLDNTIRGAHAQAMSDLIRKFSDSAIVMKLLPLAATGAAFVLLGELAFVAVSKIHDALQQAQSKVVSFDLAWAEASSNTIVKLGNLDAEILKLRDETAKLYGKPETNGPAIAAIEALTKIIDLDKGIVTTISDMEKLMKEQSVGFFDSLLTGKSETKDIESALKPKMEAAKAAYAEVLDAESQLELDTVNNASKAAINADKAVVASKKVSAKAALDAIQQEVSAQQQAVKGELAAREKMDAYVSKRGGRPTVNPQDIVQLQQQQSLQNELLSSVRLQTTSLQVQLGLETQLTQATKEHGEAEAAHSASEVAIKALAAKLKLWDAASKSAQKYTDMVERAESAEEKLGKGRMGISPQDLASIAAVDPLMAQALSSTKAEGEELSKFDAYLNQVAAAEKNVADAQTKLNETNATAPIESQIEGYKRLASEGLISQRQLISELAPLYKQEADSKIAALKAELQQETDLRKQAMDNGDVIKADDALVKEIALQNQLTQAIQKSSEEQAQFASETAKLGNSFTSYFQKMNAELNTLAATFRGTLQTSMTNAMNSFNNSIAKSVVEGKNFGQVMRQVAAQFLESMVSAGLKWLENWIIQHTVAAAFANSSAASTFATQKAMASSLAGANAVASFALAPWPIDLGAPAFGASMAAAAIGFNEGGIVPGLGNRDTVPAMLTPGETILPQAMTEKLSNATGGGQEHQHWHYSPTVHIKAWDSSDIHDAMMANKSEFIKQTRKEMRRRNK